MRGCCYGCMLRVTRGLKFSFKIMISSRLPETKHFVGEAQKHKILPNVEICSYLLTV